MAAELLSISVSQCVKNATNVRLSRRSKVAQSTSAVGKVVGTFLMRYVQAEVLAIVHRYELRVKRRGTNAERPRNGRAYMDQTIV